MYLPNLFNIQFIIIIELIFSPSFLYYYNSNKKV
jgi:hypothetical protein